MIGLLTEHVGLYENLSAHDNLGFLRTLLQTRRAEEEGEVECLLKLLELCDKKDVAAGIILEGYETEASDCEALTHGPEVLFLNEPTSA